MIPVARRALLACAAMLVLPAVAWLVVPRRHGSSPPPVSSAAAPAPAPHSARAAAKPERLNASVTGVVLDPDSHGARAATVTCEDRNPPVAATTDDEGRFELGPDAAGCAAVVKHGELYGLPSVALVAGAGNTLRLSRGGAIEGDVSGEIEAVAAYTLGIESYQGAYTDRAPVQEVRTVRDRLFGAFSWENLPPGRYVLTASAEGFPPVRSGPVEVEAGRSTAPVHIVIERGMTLRGRVLDASTRRPIAAATVTLDGATRTRASSVASGRSDDQGAYELQRVPSGPFSVRVTRDGYRPRIVTGLVTRGAPTLAEDLELNPLTDGGPSGEDFAGIGAFLEASPEGVAFARLVEDGPAEKAGLRPGDVVRRIDGADASSLASVDCMQSLRGPDGSRVTIQVDRGGQSVKVTVRRRAILLSDGDRNDPS